MKAAVLRGPQDVKVEQFPEPPMHDNCVKIAVSYCGLCRTNIYHIPNGLSLRIERYVSGYLLAL